MEDIGWMERFGPLGLPIPRMFKSNGKRECLDCGVRITAENNSGWEAFLGDGTTQPICKTCDIVRSFITEKA